MKRKKLLSGEVVPLLGRGLNEIRPCARGNAIPLPPLLHGFGPPTNGNAKIGVCRPEFKNVVECLHGPYNARDRLSRQAGTTLAVTYGNAKGTISPMAKKSTPMKYRRDFQQRLKALRVLSRLTQEQVAAELGLKDRDAYAKYETRSLPPHDLIPAICDLFSVSCDDLMRGNEVSSRPTGEGNAKITRITGIRGAL